jgi:hypothetical protein
LMGVVCLGGSRVVIVVRVRCVGMRLVMRELRVGMGWDER